MNENMKLKNEYKEMFTDIHAPEALSRKVMNMSRLENKKTGLSMMKKIAAVAAVAGALFVGSNGVVYAATGSTWVKEVIVFFNGSSWMVEMDGGERTDTITYTVIGETEMDENATDLTKETEWITGDYNITE